MLCVRMSHAVSRPFWSGAATSKAGGTVALKSVMGRGTTITISLPRASEQATSDQQQAPSKGSGTVLLVEDNPDVATTSTGLLEQLGYHVRWVTDASATR